MTVTGQSKRSILTEKPTPVRDQEKVDPVLVQLIALNQSIQELKKIDMLGATFNSEGHLAISGHLAVLAQNQVISQSDLCKLLKEIVSIQRTPYEVDEYDLTSLDILTEIEDITYKTLSVSHTIRTHLTELVNQAKHSNYISRIFAWTFIIMVILQILNMWRHW